MRRGFLLNATVLVLLIPILLLLATYEDVSTQVMQAQSERAQIERTSTVVKFLDMEFQKAMEISGKRAVVSVVDYVSVTGNFIDPKYGANRTIADLMREGKSKETSGYDTQRLMAGQTLKVWLSNISKVLKSQGYLLGPSIDKLMKSVEIKVLPLDAFNIVVLARINHVKIEDMSGTVVYEGPLPSSGDYVYSVISIQELEDPYHSAMTGGRYHRSIRACKFAYPEFTPPLTVANGSGNGNEVVVGRFGENLDYNSTHIWKDDDPDTYITNFTINGVGVKTDAVILKNNDIGVIVFGNRSSDNSGSGWCSSLRYRFNVTIRNKLNTNLVSFQVPIYIDSTHVTNPTLLNTFFSTADSDSDNIPVIDITYNNCAPTNFWIEKWDTNHKEALIWVNVTIPAGSQIVLEIYFDSTGTETRGDPDRVFDFYDDFSGTSLDTAKWITNTNQYIVSNGYIQMWGNWNNLYYINTLKSFVPSAIIEGVWKLGGYSGYDTDLTIGLVPTDTTPWLSNSAIYAWYDGYGGWRSYNRKNLRVYGAYPALGDPIYSTDWQSFQIIYTGTQIQFWDSYTNSWLTAAVSSPLSPFYIQIAADTDSSTRYGYIEWIRVRKYTPIFPTVSISKRIEQKPAQTKPSPTAASVYDLQPLKDCLSDERYFAIKSGWSFFERLEGSNTNHREYEEAANETQDELGISYKGKHYPIGLVSFMIPHSAYDDKLLNVMNTLGIGRDINRKRESSADYDFLRYYFGDGSKVEGYKVWGISYGNPSPVTSLNGIPFFLDPTTAEEVLGIQGACQLLKGYSCG